MAGTAEDRLGIITWAAQFVAVESRYYSRNAAGKYSVDVTEIRSAFGLSESLPDKIRWFRDDRVAKIVADETPVKLTGFPE
jgi:hypothetical protein